MKAQLGRTPLGTFSAVKQKEAAYSRNGTVYAADGMT